MESLTVSDLTKRFRGNNGDSLHALGPVDFQLNRGGFLCVLGPTGCGKTTLLRILAGLETPDSGAVSIPFRKDGGKPVVGYLFQQGALFPWMNVFANVSFPLKAAGVAQEERKSRIRSVLGMVNLEDFSSSYPHQLSGGMQQRAALARALVMEPDVLLMDEPFSSLDTRTSQELQQSLRELWRKAATTVIFVTHNIEEAVYLAQEVIVLGNRPGRIIRRQTIDLPDSRDRLSPEFTRYLVSLRETFESLVLETVHQSSS